MALRPGVLNTVGSSRQARLWTGEEPWFCGWQQARSLHCCLHFFGDEFLVMNGIVIQASQESVIEAVEALASSTDKPEQAQARFADWLSRVTEARSQDWL